MKYIFTLFILSIYCLQTGYAAVVTINSTNKSTYFDNNSNVLILPLVKVGSDTFNVRLKHLGNFQFSLESAEAP